MQYETIASAIISCCFHLSMDPHIQDELRKEIRDKITFPTATMSWKVLEEMPYLNGVCQETLRLYPPIPFTGREAVRETTVAGMKIPKPCSYALKLLTGVLKSGARQRTNFFPSDG